MISRFVIGMHSKATLGISDDVFTGISESAAKVDGKEVPTSRNGRG